VHERPDRRVVLTRKSPQVEIARALLTVIEPDVTAENWDATYGAGLLAESIEFGTDGSTLPTAVARSMSSTLQYDFKVPSVWVKASPTAKTGRYEYRVRALYDVMSA